MANEKPKIRIFDPKSDIADKFDFYIKVVVGILLIAVLTMLFMVGGLLLEAFHFNSATYREYLNKMTSTEITEKANQELLDQNKKNQELIIKQLEQVQQTIYKSK